MNLDKREGEQHTGCVGVGAVCDDSGDANVQVGEMIEKLGGDLGRVGEAMNVDALLLR